MQFEEQSKAATDEARKTGAAKKQVVPPDLLEEVFELNMQLEELRANKKMGEDDPALESDIRSSQSSISTQSRPKCCSELDDARGTNGTRLVDRACRGRSRSARDSDRAAAARHDAGHPEPPHLHLRNLLREVDEVLES